MSPNLNKNKEFIKLLLTTDPRQARALLSTITSKQVEAIVEIAYNLLRIANSKSDRTVLNKRRSLLKKLINKKISVGKTKKLIVLHKLAILKTLWHFKRVLLQVV